MRSFLIDCPAKNVPLSSLSAWSAINAKVKSIISANIVSNKLTALQIARIYRHSFEKCKFWTNTSKQASFLIACPPLYINIHTAGEKLENLDVLVCKGGDEMCMKNGRSNGSLAVMRSIFLLSIHTFLFLYHNFTIF